MWDEIINATDSVSTNASTNFHLKKIKYKMDCYIQHTFSLGIILLFIIANICKTWLKIKKNVLPYKNIKMDLKSFVLKVIHVIVLMT